MPEAVRNIQDTRDLDQRVDALMDDMKGAAIDAPSPPESLADIPPSPHIALRPPRPPSTSTPQPDIAALEAESPPPDAASHSAELQSALNAGIKPDAPTPLDQAAADLAAPTHNELADAVEKLISESAGTPAAAAAPLETGIASLDAELAGLADNLIAGEFAEDPPPPPEPPPPPAPAPPPEPAPAAVAASPVETPALKPAPAPVHTPPKPKLPPPPPKPSLAATLVLETFNLLSSPLRRLPAYWRDVVAWAALVNGFLALCVWIYVLVFRSDEPLPPPPPDQPAEKSSHGKADSHGKSDSHGSGHDDKPAKKTTRASSKKAAAKQADAGHH
jgi:hypothetical protein